MGKVRGYIISKNHSSRIDQLKIVDFLKGTQKRTVLDRYRREGLHVNVLTKSKVHEAQAAQNPNV